MQQKKEILFEKDVCAGERRSTPVLKHKERMTELGTWGKLLADQFSFLSRSNEGLEKQS